MLLTSAKRCEARRDNVVVQDKRKVLDHWGFPGDRRTEERSIEKDMACFAEKSLTLDAMCLALRVQPLPDLFGPDC